MTRPFLLVQVLACSLLLAGCSPPPPTHYYVLNASAIRAKDSLPRTLAVLDLDVAQQYANEPIAYRTSPVELQYYNYHRWAAAPGALARDALVSGLRQAALFRGVWAYGSLQPADYVLGGTLWAFEEWDLEYRWEARLSLDIYVVTEKTGDVVYARQFELSEVALERNPASVAEAMSRLIGHVLRTLADELPTALKRAETLT